ncbi:hypothetical protein GSI_03016 [Ganoderma sinense ZZ0214-1]|uniref:Uncharacterized protein n=1 Tax=Ganoderma sinense ZZ0214-1 TaxID=1077348 RepID=A0A2G8SN82_9APHY|nr:hypothetical protein GSI_03016 [Ganoderma sinense ZZ0214-1]
MSRTPPGDTCNDQVSDCCCNTVAFQLSMLCLNCQADTSNGAVTGFDAAPGTFEKYMGTCNTLHIDALPQDVQQAVCNLNIRLDNFLYSHWNDGSWYYVWSKENAGKEHAAHNNNTFTHCPSQISSTLTSHTPTSSTSSTGDSTATAVGAISNKVPDSGTIAGIVVSILAIVILAGLALWLVRRRRQRVDQMRASRPYRWTAAHPQMRSDRPVTREYANASPFSSLDIYPSDRRRLVFSPEAMVRGPTPAPGPAAYEVIRGRTSANPDDTDRHSRDDSRVQEPTADTPDPELPLVPLRLQTTESQVRYSAP